MGGAADHAPMTIADHSIAGSAAAADCPRCGHRFDPLSCRFIAESAASGLDPLAGVSLPADALLRFLPGRFGSDGFPIDPGGAPCRRIACPRCREEIPLSLLARALPEALREARRREPPSDPLAGSEPIEGFA